MKQVRQILKQSLHSGVFFILTYASRLLLAIALGKTLAVQDYGVYSLMTAVVGMGLSLLPLGVTQYYVREVPGLPPEEATTVFKSVVAIQTLVFLAAAALFITVPAFHAPLTNAASHQQTGIILLLLVLLLIGEGLATDFGRFLFFRKKIEQGNIVSFLQSGLWGFALFLVYILRPSFVSLQLVLFLWGCSVVSAVLYGAWRSNLRILVSAPIRLEFYRRALFFGFPLLFSQLLAVGNGFGRFVLAHHHSAQVVGIYTYHYNIILMIAAIAAPLVANPLEPYVIEAYNTNQIDKSGRLLGASFRYRIFFVIPLLIVAVFWYRPLIQLMAKKDYLVGPGLLLVLSPIPILAVFGNTFERILFLQRRSVQIGQSYLIASILQIGLYLLLVPIHPYWGAAAATNAGLGTLALLLFIFSRQTEFQIHLNLGRLGAVTCASLAVAFSTARLMPTHLPPALLLASTTVLIGASFLLFSILFGLLSEGETRILWDLIRRKKIELKSMVLGEAANGPR